MFYGYGIPEGGFTRKMLILMEGKFYVWEPNEAKEIPEMKTGKDLQLLWNYF